MEDAKTVFNLSKTMLIVLGPNSRIFSQNNKKTKSTSEGAQKEFDDLQEEYDVNRQNRKKIAKQ